MVAQAGRFGGASAASRAGSARPLALARWLLAVAALVVLIVAVGGITRLTESGLSITEWKPVTGAIPPLSEAQWQAEFAAYQRIREYRQINGPAGMTLADYKFIYFWEWLHRLLGRLIGLAFALPLAWFWVRGAIPAGYKPRLLALLALGGLQGVFGWYMVRSGLSGEVTDVSHFWLSIHLLTALFTLAGLVWTALDLLALARDPAARPARLTGLARGRRPDAVRPAAARRLGRRAQRRARLGHLAADAGAAGPRGRLVEGRGLGADARSVPAPFPAPLVGLGRGRGAGRAGAQGRGERDRGAPRSRSIRRSARRSCSASPR